MPPRLPSGPSRRAQSQNIRYPEMAYACLRSRRLTVRGDSILLRACAARYFVTFDAGCDAMDDGALDEAAAGAFFMNFVSGI